MNNASLLLIIIGLVIIWYFLPKTNNEPEIEEEWKPEPIPKQTNINDHIPLTGHCLVVGQTGSGKSNVLMSQIIRRIDAGHKVHIVDSKKEFKPLFKRHCNVIPMSDAKELFSELIAVADDRMELFAETSEEHKRPCRNATEYRKITGKALPTISVLVDELIVLRGEIDEKELINLLVIGRSSEVFVICASQYIKADILSRKGIVNFTNRVFLGEFDTISARLLFDNLEKENVEMIKSFVGNPGMAALKLGSKVSVAVMPEVTDQYLMRFL